MSHVKANVIAYTQHRQRFLCATQNCVGPGAEEKKLVRGRHFLDHEGERLLQGLHRQHDGKNVTRFMVAEQNAG
jgi:hypothetical protein